MHTGGRLIAGSHNRNEFVLINAEENGRIKSVRELSGQICMICGDEIEVTVDGEPFVACNECAFPVCRPCYEYERKEGNQACPQCKTRYKRLKGSPRVEGDEEEDGDDDLDNEFDYDLDDMGQQPHSDSLFSGRLNTGRGSNTNISGANSEHGSPPLNPEIPLLTYGEEDPEISSDRHALIVPPYMNHGNRVHPMPYTDPSIPLQPRPMVPKKDIAVYGYGSVAWKDRMEEWKKRQSDKLQVVKHEGDNNDGSGSFGDDFDDPDLPMMDEGRQPLSRKSVYLAELSSTRTCFAMKVMNKTELSSRKKLPRAQTEREILQSLDHPFLPSLYTHFETESFSCLVMEFCPGGDLHALRQRQPGKYFSEHAARFYVAEVLLALEYLHMLGIIYRDLKPENVLVREDGH